jgi:hypothetical protein
VIQIESREITTKHAQHTKRLGKERELSPNTTEVRRVVAESRKNHQEHKEHDGEA